MIEFAGGVLGLGDEPAQMLSAKPGMRLPMSGHMQGVGTLQAARHVPATGRPFAVMPPSTRQSPFGSLPDPASGAAESAKQLSVLSPGRSTSGAVAREYSCPSSSFEGAGPEMMTGSCPKGHVLQRHVIACWGAWCDGCMQAIDVGTSVMDCRECNWLLCTERCSKLVALWNVDEKTHSVDPLPAAAGDRPHDASPLHATSAAVASPSKLLESDVDRPPIISTSSAELARSGDMTTSVASTGNIVVSEPEERTTATSDIEFLKQMVATHAEDLLVAEARIEELESEKRSLLTKNEFVDSAKTLLLAEARIEELESEKMSLKTRHELADSAEALRLSEARIEELECENPALTVADHGQDERESQIHALLAENAKLRSQLKDEESPRCPAKDPPFVPPSRTIPFLNLSTLTAASERRFCAVSPATTSSATTISSRSQSELSLSLPQGVTDAPADVLAFESVDGPGSK